MNLGYFLPRQKIFLVMDPRMGDKESRAESEFLEQRSGSETVSVDEPEASEASTPDSAADSTNAPEPVTD